MANPFKIDRRALMASAILLVGGTLAGLPGELLAQAPRGPRFFTPVQFAVLEEVAGIIIPLTDTPGAREAGVPAFIDALLADWASAARQAQARALIDELGATGGGLMALDGPARIEAVRAYDAAALGGGNDAYRRLKELVLTTYYLSEPGATQELRYELAPGVWEPNVPMTPDTRAWAV